MRMLPDQLAPQPAWRPVTRVAFRFIALYFFLYVVMTQMLGALLVWPAGSLPDLCVLDFVHAASEILASQP
jgi:hypothetical protein